MAQTLASRRTFSFSLFCVRFQGEITVSCEPRFAKVNMVVSRADAFHIVVYLAVPNVNAWCFLNVFIFYFFNGRFASHIVQSSLMHREEKSSNGAYGTIQKNHSWRSLMNRQFVELFCDDIFPTLIKSADLRWNYGENVFWVFRPRVRFSVSGVSSSFCNVAPLINHEFLSI